MHSASVNFIETQIFKAALTIICFMLNDLMLKAKPLFLKKLLMRCNINVMFSFLDFEFSWQKILHFRRLEINTFQRFVRKQCFRDIENGPHYNIFSY